MPGQDLQTVSELAHGFMVLGTGEGQSSVAVPERRAGALGRRSSLVTDLLPGKGRGSLGIKRQPPQKRGAVGQRRGALFYHRGAHVGFVQVQGGLIMAHAQLEKGLVPGQVDVVGGPLVETLQPRTKEIAALGSVPLLEVNVGHRMSGHGIGWLHVQGPVGQLESSFQPAGFVVGKGVRAQESPVVVAVLLQARTQSE